MQYVLFVSCFIFIFAFLLSHFNLQFVQELPPIESVDPFQTVLDLLNSGLLSGVVQILYAGTASILLNILLFITVLPHSGWRKFLQPIFNRYFLLFWAGYIFFLYLIEFMEWAQFPAIATLVMTFLFSTVLLFILVIYYLRCGLWMKILSSLMTIGVMILTWHTIEVSPALNVGTRIFLLVVSIFFMAVIFNFYFLSLTMFITFFAFVFVLDLNSAQSGKIILFRALLVREFISSTSMYEHSLSLLKKWSYSDNLIAHAIRIIFQNKAVGMNYLARLRAIQSLAGTDLSLRYPLFLAQYIKHRNRANLTLSFLVTGMVLVIFLTVLPFTPRKSEAIVILMVFIGCRLLSRTCEICHAFFRDALSAQPKTSTLTGADRVKLAILSIVEIAVTSAMLYFLFCQFERIHCIVALLNSGYSNYAMDTLRVYGEALLKGFAIGMFNLSYPSEPLSWTHVVHLFQVVNSVILITLSIANYLNMKKDVHLYVADKTRDRLTIKYASFFEDGETIIREAVSGKDEEEVANRLLEIWRDREIGDRDYKEMRECIKSDPGKLPDLEKVKWMTTEQLDQYVRETLKTTGSKDGLLAFYKEWLRPVWSK